MIKNLTPDMHGKKISCEIKGTPIKDAMIVCHDKRKYFLLHNDDDYRGDRYPGDYQGYKYSWSMNNGSEEQLLNGNIKVTNIVFKDTSPEIY